jgi:pimeloyl-ACP methyl ester carboxylesterase
MRVGHNDVPRHVRAASLVLAAALSVLSACGSDEPSTEQSTPDNGHPVTSDTTQAATTSLESPTSSTATTTSLESPSASTAAAPTTTITNGIPPTPPGDFYVPPDPLPDAQPGTLIWAEPVELEVELNPPSVVWRILYHSRDSRGTDIAVSGFAVVPDSPAPSEGRDVYAWGHGTVGPGDQCAPSRDVLDHLPVYGGQQLERGAVLVATDYAGLGTPGVPDGDSRAEGQSLLDSVRAVQSLPGVGTTDDLVIAGHSQGGTVTLFAGEIAGDYAPELALVGLVALAPGGEFPMFVDALATSTSKGLVLIGASGMRAAHPEIDLGASLTPNALADLDRVDVECVDDTVGRYSDVDPAEVFVAMPSTVDAIDAVLIANSPSSAPLVAPLMLAQGSDDLPVQVELTGMLVNQYCALGGEVTSRVYAGADHEGVLDAGADDVLQYITDRYDHVTPAVDCP